MKKIIHGLLAAASVMSPFMLSADVANKTFIADRGTLSSNCLLGLSSGAKDCKKDGLGADITVAGFFRQSHNNTKLARYFGGGTTAADQNGTIEVATGTTGTTNALYGWQVDYTATESQAAYGTVTLNPRRTEVGAQVQWNQCLNKLVKGLWFSVAAPVVYVRTEMRATYDQTANATGAANAGLGNNLSDIFSGNVTGRTSPVIQSALTNQKLTSTYNHETGVADVSAVLGYKFVEEANYSFSGSVHANIPTGNKQAGVVAFEPIYGSRNFSFGAGLHGNFNLWRSEDKKSELNMHACGKYSYGFGAEQVRTLGLSSNTDGVVAAGHYSNVAKAIATDTVLPLANVSTLAVTVEPKSRIEAVAGFCYRFNRISVDVAYNLFYNQAENVKVKALWDETSHGRPVSGEATPVFTDLTETDYITGGAILAPGNTANSYTVDLSAASTPAQLVHKVGGGVNYSFETKLPISLGAGADVELSSNNHSINSWSVWAKLGFSF
jgi:hypothetical protein